MPERYKYPRTPLLPWSPSADKDDIVLPDARYFSGKRVIVTEKLDGECFTIYNDYAHARSTTRSRRDYRSWIFQLQAKLAKDIPDGWRACGEYMFAKHSIPYENLESYFYMFSMWSDYNLCLPWDETEAWARLLGLPVPRILYAGGWDEKVVRGITFNAEECEGYVVRNAAGFEYKDFNINTAKCVRANHVQSDDHWIHGPIVKNGLRPTTKGQ